MAIKYNLNIPEFDAVVSDFSTSLGSEFEISKTEPKGQIVFSIKKKGEKKPSSILTCYNSAGRISFNFGGTDQSTARKLSVLLVEHTEIKIGDKKSFTIKPATKEEVETIIEFLKTDSQCTIDNIEPTTTTISYAAKITGKHHDVITLTHYKTGTLLVQGRSCLTFSNFIEIASELFNPVEVKKEHFKLFDISEDDVIISTNLSTHLPDAYMQIGVKLDAIMAPSLILLNSPKEMSDYTAYAFPILRGTEGILKKIFSLEGPIITDSFGDFFRTDYKSGSIAWVKDCSALFPDENLRKSLLSLYQFYYKERHTLFHTDETIESSRTLNYEEALGIVKKGLHLINEVYKHPN